MILDTVTIREGLSTIQLTSDLETVKDRLPPLSEALTSDVTLNRTTATISARIVFRGGIELECARCCVPFRYPVSGDITLILQERDGVSGAAQEGDIADYFYNAQEPQVDISPALYDEIMISLPLKPLCSEGCPGISFGGDREQRKGSGDAECDPRWEALRKLQKK